MDRISGFDPDGCRFEPCWSHLIKANYLIKVVGFLISILLFVFKTKDRYKLVYKNFKTRNKSQSTHTNYNSNYLFKGVELSLFPVIDFN